MYCAWGLVPINILHSISTYNSQSPHSSSFPPSHPPPPTLGQFAAIGSLFALCLLSLGNDIHPTAILTRKSPFCCFLFHFHCLPDSPSLLAKSILSSRNGAFPFAAEVLTLNLHSSYLSCTEGGRERCERLFVAVQSQLSFMFVSLFSPTSPFPILILPSSCPKINRGRKDKWFWLAFKMLSTFNESITSNHQLCTNCRQGCKQNANIFGMFWPDCPSVNFSC